MAPPSPAEQLWRQWRPWLTATLVVIGTLAVLALALVVLPPFLVPAGQASLAAIAKAAGSARGNWFAGLVILAVLYGVGWGLWGLSSQGGRRNGERERRPRRRLVILALAVGVLTLLGGYVYFAGWYLPPIILKNPALDSEGKLKAVGDVRSAFLGVLVPVAALIAGGVAYLNYRETVAVARRGQVTDRFTKAIEQLGKGSETANLHLRLGGIYALEQIALDSAELHWPVMEVLTAFLRESSISPTRVPASGPGPDTQTPDAATQTRGPLAADLQAILTVLGRRPEERRRQEGYRRLDLRGARLPGADLDGAHLERADLDSAGLEGAKLILAELSEANLSDVRLDGAQLFRANLQEARMHRAHLEGATLEEAYLERTKLFDAHLDETDLKSAHLEGTQLGGADLSRALRLTREQLKNALCDEGTKLPNDLTGTCPDWRAGLPLGARLALGADPDPR